MPWLIQHKCNPGQVELSSYGMAKIEGPGGRKMTHAKCPSCGEELIFEGHEIFETGRPTGDYPGLQAKGFQAVSRRPS